MRGLGLWSESWPTPAGIWWKNAFQTQVTRAASAEGHGSPGALQRRHPKEHSTAFRKHRTQHFGAMHLGGSALMTWAGFRQKGQGRLWGAPEALLSWSQPPLPQVFAQPTTSAGLQSNARVHDQGRAESWSWAQTHRLGSQAGGTTIPEDLPKHSGGTELLAHSGHRLKPSGWITTGRGHWRMLETWLISRTGKSPSSAKPKTIQSSN